MQSEMLETSSLHGARLRVEFLWTNDRYRHVISVVDGNETATPALESIEGTPADDWPASPPLQSLSMETLPDGRRVALLVGMSGRSHWSASIEPDSSQAGLICDIACRHATQPSWLGSRYRQLSDAAQKLVFESNSAEVVREAIVAIRPTTAAIQKGTTRWEFAIRLKALAAD